MLRSLLPALVAAATLLSPAAATAGSGRPLTPEPGVLRAGDPRTPPSPVASTRKAAGGNPLAVSIDGLTSPVIPVRGPIVVSGRVTNLDDRAWRNIKVYAAFGAPPMTTERQLAAAAASDVNSDIGGRVVDDDTPDTAGVIPVLAPGQTATYSFRVPRADLTLDGESVPVTAPGVYWFGVNALGENDDGRDLNADGRARTFLPLVPPGSRPVRTALVVPVRHEVTYAADGSIANLQEWTETLGDGGRLRSLVDLGAAAGSRPVTWLVDPAVVDAARRIAAGNPPRSIAPNLTAPKSPPATASPTPAPTPSPTTGPTTTPGPLDRASISARSVSPSTTATPTTTPTTTPSPPPDVVSHDPEVLAAATAATEWLGRLRAALGHQQILALPYGDPDLAAAAELAPALYNLARQRSGTMLAPWGLHTSPAVSSPSGYLDAGVVKMVDPASTILATDQLFGARAPTVAGAAGRRVLVTSAGAAAGGPTPGDPLALFALRQRILAEAALHALAPGERPLLVTLPENWTPRLTSGFYQGLDRVPWLELSDVAHASQYATRPVDLTRLRYPRIQARLQLGAGSFDAAKSLIRSGAALQDILLRNDQIGGQVTDQALASTSYASRTHPVTTSATTVESREWIRHRLGEVQITGPPSVTLSSATGHFTAIVANHLDQSVRVQIVARSDPGMTVDVPRNVEIAAHGRKTVFLEARTTKRTKDGVHRVRLTVTDSNGRRLGSHADVPIRAAEVSNLIWLALALGAGLLFGTLALRVFRRIRRAPAEAS